MPARDNDRRMSAPSGQGRTGNGSAAAGDRPSDMFDAKGILNEGRQARTAPATPAPQATGEATGGAGGASRPNPARTAPNAPGVSPVTPQDAPPRPPVGQAGAPVPPDDDLDDGIVIRDDDDGQGADGAASDEEIRGALAEPEEDARGNLEDDLSDEGDPSKRGGSKAGKFLARMALRTAIFLLPILMVLVGVLMLAQCISELNPLKGSFNTASDATNINGVSVGSEAVQAAEGTGSGTVTRKDGKNSALPRVSIDPDLADLFEEEEEEEEPPYATYVATFFGSNEDWTDTLYVSDDCITFKAMGTVPNGQRDPCIMFHDKRYWVVTCLNDEDGHLWLMVSSSPDLKTWTGPTKNGPFALDRLPNRGGQYYDVVAPEWYQNEDGSIYVIVSCGYWGACHGEDTNDFMDAYMLEVSSLKMSGKECELKSNGPARWMSVNMDGADRIDGTIDYTDGKYYLTIKRNGLNMELWENTTLSPSGWVRTRECSLYGFEAPCVFQKDGTWHMLADGVPDIEPYGTRRWESPTIDGQWVETPIHFLREDGSEVGVVRHGTVLPVEGPGQGKGFETISKYLPAKGGRGTQQDGSLDSKQQAVVNACRSVGSPGSGLCALWVGDVYEAANVGVSFRGHAYDWYYECCQVGAPHYGGTVESDPNRSTLKPGMVIAVPSSSSGSSAGATYGHVGIYIGNNQVMHNIGEIDTCSVQEWIDRYGQYAPVGWGYPPGMK